MADMLRILIADDNDSDRLILSTIVKKQGHQVFCAADGSQAVETFENERPDIVLLDALMPKMDGFEAARQIRKLAGEELVPIIFLTSLKDAASLAECLDAGGADFLSKPYNRVILEAKISAFGRLRQLQETVREQRDRLELHHDRLIHEQEVAKSVFDNIAHPGCMKVPNIRYLLSPMAVFNGDMAVAARKPDGGMYVLLGDFTGHGLPAAIGAMPASEIFYGMSNKGFSMQEILAEINKKLKRILPVGVFCCTAMVDFNYEKEIIQVWLGGLPDIFHYKVKTKEIVEIKSKHLPLGVLSPERFNSEVQVFPMARGDKLYLWSDGIHEACNADDEMFGTEQLRKTFENTQDPNQLFDETLREVERFTNNSAQDDDHTMVEVTMVTEEEFKLSFGEKPKQVVENAGGPLDWTLVYILRPQTLAHFNPLPLLTHVLMDVPGLRQQSSKLYTILAELYSNGLEHGVLGISSKLKESADGFSKYYRKREEKLKELESKNDVENVDQVQITLIHKPTEKGGCLTMRVEDTGQGFDYQKYTHLADGNSGYCGRGVSLIASMCSRFEYFGVGNIVEADFDWKYE